MDRDTLSLLPLCSSWKTKSLRRAPDSFTELHDLGRGDGSGGILARNETTGICVCWDGAAISSLDQAQVRELVLP